jgi:LacI family transcriptional regulator
LTIAVHDQERKEYMANRRITMQDIADACGLSRNTVSKVFNGRSNVTPTTRAYILQKAEELGYGVPREQRAGTRQHYDMSVALLTHHMPADSHFGTFFVTAFTDQISRAGYTLKMYEISDEELAGRIFPPDFSAEQTAGII